MTIEDARLDAIKNGGGTYSFSGFRHFEKAVKTAGFLVSDGQNEVRIQTRLPATYVSAYAQDFIESLDYLYSYLGFWFDKGSGHWFLDRSEHHETEFAAVAFAKANKQITYWDCAAGIAKPVKS